MDIREALQQRILILDGAMGTFIQSLGLSGQSYHKGRLANWPVSLVGNNDVLNLSSPDVIEQIHRRYVEAGADIIETNTFSSNRIASKSMVVSNWWARWLSKEPASHDELPTVVLTGTFGWRGPWDLPRSHCRWLPI